MYEPEDQEPVRREIDWDAWEKNRFSGWNRWWLLISLLSMAAMVGVWIASGGDAIPWGPPR